VFPEPIGGQKAILGGEVGDLLALGKGDTGKRMKLPAQAASMRGGTW